MNGDDEEQKTDKGEEETPRALLNSSTQWGLPEVRNAVDKHPLEVVFGGTAVKDLGQADSGDTYSCSDEIKVLQLLK